MLEPTKRITAREGWRGSTEVCMHVRFHGWLIRYRPGLPNLAKIRQASIGVANYSKERSGTLLVCHWTGGSSEEKEQDESQVF